MKVILNRGYEYVQPIEFEKYRDGLVRITIGKAPYNEHDTEVTISDDECRDFANQILEWLDSDD